MYIIKDKSIAFASKNTCLAQLQVAAFFLLSFFSHAGEGTGLSLEGSVKDNTCAFDAGSTVVLDPVVRQYFSGKGSVLGITPLSVKLQSCGSEAGKVDITISGTGVPEDEFAFANTSTGDGSATGVGLYFYQGEGNVLFRPDGAVIQSETTLKPSTDNTLKFRAGYVALTGTPVAGSFSAVVNVLLEYR